LCYRTSGGNDHWLGLKKPQESKDAVSCCEWVDGNPSTYRNWLPDKPDRMDEMCVRMTSNGQYNDRDCDVDYRYICKAKGIISLQGYLEM